MHRREQQERADAAAEALKVEVERRQGQGEPAFAKDRGAVPFLQKHGLTRAQARTLLEENNGSLWLMKQAEGERGNPLSVVPRQGKSENGGANSSTLEPLQTLDKNDTYLRRPHEQGTAQIPPFETLINTGIPETSDLRRDGSLLIASRPPRRERVVKLVS